MPNMPRLSDLPEVQRNKLLMRPVRINDGSPWTPPRSDVAHSRLALVTTAGLHHRGDTPFLKYDQTYRVIDRDVAESDLLQSQSSIGFDRGLRIRDINVVFPVDRLHELVADGSVGSLTSAFYSLTGAQANSEQTAETIGAQLGPLLREQGADLVLITPTCPFCTHTASALARVLETHGLSTVLLALVREFVEKTRPPRAVFVPFPFGAPVGMPHDREQQSAVLRTALNTFAAPSGPVLVDFEADLPPGVSPAPAVASTIGRTRQPDLDAATETSMMRRYYEQRLAEQGGRTAVGLSGIPVVRFRGVIRSFEAFAENSDADIRERPQSVPRPEFIRYCADDLKAMYLEARIMMKPGEPPEQANRWLWGETALGRLLVDVKDQMERSADEGMRAAGYGIAR
jgi:D-proline reductase (dithiol) PrdB